MKMARKAIPVAPTMALLALNVGCRVFFLFFFGMSEMNGWKGIYDFIIYTFSLFFLFRFRVHHSTSTIVIALKQ
jgi:hypothetical protein